MCGKRKNDISISCVFFGFFFFFQAEDGIRDLYVTGVQTCALPICGDRGDLAAEVASRLGGADLLIDNAGVTMSGTFEQNRMADVDWLLEINLHAVLRMTKAFLPQLLARPGSHLVNISSLFGLIAPPGQVAYSTSKYAVRGFTEALRHELEPRGVGVTMVHPGGVRTNIALHARISGPDADGAQVADNRRFHETALTLPPEEA